MSTISVTNLSKTFSSPIKQPGVWGSIKSLVKRNYKTVSAVKDISFEINQGELVGFIGPNGAGKTTTLKMLSGLLHPTTGTIDILGYTPFERKGEYLKKISLVMGQKNQLWWDLPAADTFLLHKELYDVPTNQFKTTLNELTDLLELEEKITRPVRTLSLGQRMKCELAAALLHRPQILFLDEPTIGLDIVVQKKVREFIKEYNKKYNATVILTSHYMDDVKEICDRVIMIDKGTLMFDGPIDDMIKKYAGHKLLTLIINGKVHTKDFEEFGEVEDFTLPKVVLKVPREKTSKIASLILSRFEVDDLEINEPDLEEIVRIAFGQRGS
jgi:ABC-2 type transport system ATP-binding protein